MNQVTLGYSELLMASTLASMTFIKAELKNKTERYAASYKDRIAHEHMGRYAEVAVAKYLDRHFQMDLNQFSGADVSNNVQVRSTTHLSGHLMVYEKDNSDHLYVLVVGEIPELTIAGAIYGRDAKHKKYWVERSGCYWIPQSDLYELQKSGEIVIREGIQHANSNGG